MPIVGLTDNIIPTFPEIGRLRKGKKKSGNGPGADLEYFRFTSNRPEVLQAFYAAYPAKPVRINVVLPHDSAEENMTVWMEEWGASLVLKHRCDGQHVVRRWNQKTGEYENFPLGEGPPCPYTPEGGKLRTEECPGCGITGRLTVVVPELIAAGFVGYVTVLTGSNHDVRSMLATLFKTEEERGRRGKTLAWLPFTLERVKEEISSPAWKNEEPGKRHKVVKSLLKLTPSEEWVRAQVALARSEYLALPMPTQAQVVLEHNRQILHGDEAEWDEIIENGDDGEQTGSMESGNGPATDESKPEQVRSEQSSEAESGNAGNGNRDNLLKAWHILRSSAQQLGLQVGALPPDATDVQIASAGKTLRDRVREEWISLCAGADSLGVERSTLPDNAGGAQIAEAALALKPLVVKAAERALDEAAPAPEKRTWPAAIVQAIVGAHLAVNDYAAVGLLDHSQLSVTDELDLCVEWARKYREGRNAGGTVEDAASIANAWLGGLGSVEQEEMPL